MDVQHERRGITAMAVTCPSLPRPHRRSAQARRTGPAAILLLSAAGAVCAQQATPQQIVRGPVATYWMTADTSSGIGAMTGGGMSAMLGMLAGRAPAAQRTLDLRLGSSQSPSAAPQAAHAIPPGMQMGESLPLVSPEPSRPAPVEPEERTLPQGMEQPKGRMLIFWGCGETAGPGQPVIIDFSRIGPGQPMPNLVSRAVRGPRPPGPGTNRSFGSWPNPRDPRPVPAQASLRGAHEVRGNYSPDIRFTIDRHDFMPAVELTAAERSGGGAQPLRWATVTGATGYFLAAFGAGTESAGGGTDIVMWTSSAVQEMGGSMTDHIAPAEVARLIRERVVLPPDRTECTVPSEVIRAMPMGMLSFSAYGDELNLAHPPRPQDPKQPWDIQWTVKLRMKSTTSMPLGEGMAGLGSGGPPSSRAASREAPAPAAPPADPGTASAPAAPASPSSPPAANEAIEQGVREGVRVLRGLFGR